MDAICIKDLGKAYRQYPTRWARLLEWLPGASGPRHTLRWVLHEVSFTVKAGEAVGIVGMNGAGKSTLLKLITGTSQATTGTVQVVGRVAALLELGMGFHPDFSGRQNAITSGQLLGISAADMQVLMPEIEAFAEIGSYMDMPVRVYSSGMQMRLAFSVATCVRPDVLIVDEALSVGDAYFQHKSFNRIREFGKLGTTLLIVSHDRAAVQSICSRAILLRDGCVALDGDPETVLDYYNAALAQTGLQRDTSALEQLSLADGRVQTVSGSKEAVVELVELLNAQGEPIEMVRVGEPVVLKVTVRVNAPVPRLVLGYGIKNRLGQVMYGTNTWHTGQVLEAPEVGDRFVFLMRFDANLGVGSYSVQTALVDSDSHLTANYEWRDLALVFNVVNVDKWVFDGAAWLQPQVSIETL
ncbi:ABC transporter ATP-binding protein [Rhodoferax sp.]|uniref:ABC transporter ATP-binding protein n=1 Tax=Rhodoferax sp. TaxID=50421 RepID=UPI002618F711|nr:ABC transporter ATP-binding protein [Rhodoferax sp.]MDD2809712.1 ABC transporter ATP-binding protein [Rhodoferax sp.]